MPIVSNQRFGALKSEATEGGLGYTHHEALEKGAAVGRDRRPRAEQPRLEYGLPGANAVPHDGRDHAGDAHGHGQKGRDAQPVVLHARPGEANEEARHAGEEEEAPDPVDAPQFGGERRFLGTQLDVDGDEDQAEEAKGELRGTVSSLFSFFSSSSGVIGGDGFNLR